MKYIYLVFLLASSKIVFGQVQIEFTVMAENSDNVYLTVNSNNLQKHTIGGKEKLIKYEIENIQSIEDVNSLSINFEQISRSNKIQIGFMRVTAGDRQLVFSGCELSQVFNPNYFVIKRCVSEQFFITTNRYWNRPAVLFLNESMGNLVNLDTRNHLTFKIEGEKPQRSVFTTLYYNTTEGSGRISKYYNSDSIYFDIYTSGELVNFQLFLGDYKNKIVIDEFQIIENGKTSSYTGNSILERFGFNLFINPQILDEGSLTLEILNYIDKTNPLITYSYKGNTGSERMPDEDQMDFEMDIYMKIIGNDDIIKTQVFSKDERVINNRRLLKYQSAPFHLKYTWRDKYTPNEIEITFENLSNQYQVDSIIVTAGDKKRVFDSSEILNEFLIRNLDYIEDEGIYQYNNSGVNYISMYFETDYIFHQDRVKNILLRLVVFFICVFLLYYINKKIFLSGRFEVIPK